MDIFKILVDVCGLCKKKNKKKNAQQDGLGTELWMPKTEEAHMPLSSFYTGHLL